MHLHIGMFAVFGAFSLWCLVIQSVANKRPPTKTAISQNLLGILLRNFIRLFSRVDCIITTYFIRLC